MRKKHLINEYETMDAILNYLKTQNNGRNQKSDDIKSAINTDKDLYTIHLILTKMVKDGLLYTTTSIPKEGQQLRNFYWISYFGLLVTDNNGAKEFYKDKNFIETSKWHEAFQSKYWWLILLITFLLGTTATFITEWILQQLQCTK
jgi:hypothetical protein